MNFREPGLEEKFRTDTVIADRESGKVVNPHFRQIFCSSLTSPRNSRIVKRFMTN